MDKATQRALKEMGADEVVKDGFSTSVIALEKAGIACYGVHPGNTSGHHPQGRAVLVQPWEPEITGAILRSKLIIPSEVREKTVVMENRVRVIEIGACAWMDEPRPRAKVGEICLVTRLAGFTIAGYDGQIYRLVNDRDLFCTCDEPEVNHAAA